MTAGFEGQPHVRRNEWEHLSVPEVGSWEPTLSVSVVIPAYDAGSLLPVVLAGLAAQTYPAHLLEVVVVDDGPGPLVLPEVRPERTRVVEVTEGWGRANACHTGALAADGDVVHWLDADMLTEADEVEAQLRWHHVTDYGVVLGHKWFVDATPALEPTPAEVRDAVAAGRLEELFAGVGKAPHEWVETIYGRTDDLRRAGQYALRTHVGATASVHRALYLESGGMDVSLRLGEDVALGYRLHQVGAFFVPDRAARSWHLGQTHVMTHQGDVNEFNDPFHADRSPALHVKRFAGRSYAAPYLEVELDARGHAHADVIGCVTAVLTGTLHDLRVRLRGAWASLTDERRPTLDDPRLGDRIVHATFAGDPRVQLVEADDVASGGSEATFVLTLDDPTIAPRRMALERLLLHVEHTHDGLRRLLVDGRPWGWLVRTSALARARRLDSSPEELWGGADVEASAVGFVPVADGPRRRYPQTGGPPMSSDEAWTRINRSLRKGKA